MKVNFGLRYHVDIKGRVFSLDYNKTKTIKELTPIISNCGYLRVCLSEKGKTKSYSVHRIVALVHIKNPNNKTQVNHKNGIRTDNRKGNLEWMTSSENHLHAINELGRPHPMKGKTGSKHPCSISVIKFSLAGKFIKKYGSVREAADDSGTYTSAIVNQSRGLTKQAGGYMWKYVK